MVGTLNKIPIALLGSLLFSARMTTQGYVFVSVNLAGCLLYSYCKVLAINPSIHPPINPSIHTHRHTGGYMALLRPYTRARTQRKQSAC